VKILQAFRHELQPTNQERNMRCFAGCRRAVYNRALALQSENYAAGNKYICYASLAKYLTAWRSDPHTMWPLEAPYHIRQQASLRKAQQAMSRKKKFSNN
jgi:putative transposase